MNSLDRTVASMMSKFGTTAYISAAISEDYDPTTSENVVTYHDYPVNAMFFDYVRKTEGEGTEHNTLIKTGDKQVYVQPPQKNDEGLPLPHFSPNRDYLKVGVKTYKIITLKQLNPSLTTDGCVLYELYVRE
jgi:hypothetical protein